ncbi:MAG: glycosyltransferase [Planctomycetota bacterium]
MKIALLSFEYPPETASGDAGAYAFWHSRALAALGHEVHVFAGSKKAGERTTWDGPVAVTRVKGEGIVHALGEGARERGLERFGARVSRAADLAGALRRRLHREVFDVVEVAAAEAEVALFLGRYLPVVVRIDDAAARARDLLDGALGAAAARAGIARASAVSASSDWLLQGARRRAGLRCPSAVLPNALDVIALDRAPQVEARERLEIPTHKWIVVPGSSLEGAPRDLPDMLAELMERRPGVTCVVLGRAPRGSVVRIRRRLEARGSADRLMHVRRPSEPNARACMRGAAALLWPGTPRSCPYPCLEAMAGGRPIVGTEGGGFSELFRPDIDALLVPARDADALGVALERVLAEETLASALGTSARQRVEERCDARALAAKAVGLYAQAGGEGAVDLPVVSVDPAALLGPDNWFDCWWLGDARSEIPGLATDQDRRPKFAELELDELRFVDVVLSRAWSDAHSDWGSPEADFLRQLHHLYLAEVADRRRDPDADSTRTPLALPPLTHPMFAEERAAHFLDEMWRIESRPQFREWVQTQALAPWFVDAAVERVSLRRIAIAAARSSPGPATFDIVRRIYRDPQHHERVVQQDRDYIAKHTRADSFRAAITEMGLHAPLERPLALMPAPLHLPALPASAPPKVTVLIPSYRHETFVAGAIDSVLRQSMPDLAVLVVDDHSPDKTAAVARRLRDPRLTVRGHRDNIGLGPRITGALAGVQSPYLALLNSDDLFHHERLQRCVELLDADPDAALVATGMVFADQNGRQLTAHNSCSVDVGPQAHGWLSWYESIASELGAGERWTDFAHLLKQNHLATSSNMVFRTEWLRQHMPAAQNLRYCVDWLLFLFAAMDGSLRYLPQPLLAYRFHQSNTVWFTEGGRDDYALEVAGVVAAALRRWLARRAKQHGAPQARRELAVLLEDCVAQHGEVDGMVLFYRELTRRLPGGKNEQSTPELESLGEGALERKKLLTALRGVAEDPWYLAALARDKERHRTTAHAAEAFVQRVRELEAQREGLRRDAERSRERADDERALRERAVQTQERDAQEVVRLRQRTEDLRTARDREAQEVQRLRQRTQDLRSARDRLENESHRLSLARERIKGERDKALAALGERDALVRERDVAQQELDVARQELDVARQEQEVLRGEIGEVRRERDNARAERREARQAREVAAERAERLQGERDAVTRQLEEVERERDEVLNELEAVVRRMTGEWQNLHSELAAKQLHLEQLDELHRVDLRRLRATLRDQLESVYTSHEWRAGQLLLDRCFLRKPFKTVLRLHAHASVRGRRTVAKWGAKLRRSAGAPRVALVCSTAFPRLENASLAWEARQLAESGCDVRLVSWGRGPASLLHELDRAVLKTAHVLQLDSSLQERDRNTCAKLYPEGFAALDARLGVVPHVLARVCSVAVSVTALGVTYVHGSDLGESAITAHGVSQLLGIPYGVTVAPAVTEMDDPVIAALPAAVAGADLVITPTTADAERLLLECDLDERRVTVKPPAVYWDAGPIAAGPQNGSLRAALSAPDLDSDFNPLVDAVLEVERGGLAVRLDLLAAHSLTGCAGLDRLYAEARARDLADRFVFPDLDPVPPAVRLARNSLLIAPGGNGTVPPIEVLVAMAAGLPVVAGDRQSLAGLVRDGEEGLVIPVGDADALAEALNRLAKDEGLRRRLGARARARFESELAPAASGAEATERVRVLATPPTSDG